MHDSRPLHRRAKPVLIFAFMALTIVWPLIVPPDVLVPYTYMCGGALLVMLGFVAGVDWQKAKGGVE